MAFSSNLASLFVNIIVNSAKAHTNIQRIQQGLNRTTQQARQMQLTFAKIRTAAAGFYILSNALRTMQATLTDIVQTTAELERTFNRIRNAADFDTGTLKEFKKDLFDLSEKLRAIPTQNLQSIALAAAQAGITGKEDILKFTEAVGKVSVVAENISSGELARFLLLLKELFRGSIDDIELYGNSLHVLAQDFRTTEAEIVKVAEKIAGASANFGLSVDQTLALSTALRHVGVTAERASSFASRMFRELAINAENFQSVLNLKTGFAGRVQDTPLEAMLEVLKAISLQGKDTSTTLVKLNLDDVRVLQSVQSLTRGYDKFIEALNKGEASIKNTSKTMEDYNVLANDLAGSLTNLNNAWTRLKDSLGDNIVLIKAVDLLASLVKLVNENPWLLLNAVPGGGLIAGIGGPISQYRRLSSAGASAGGLPAGTGNSPAGGAATSGSTPLARDKAFKLLQGMTGGTFAKADTVGGKIGEANKEFAIKLLELSKIADLDKTELVAYKAELENLRLKTIEVILAEQALIDAEHAREREIEQGEVVQKQFEQRMSAMQGVAGFLGTPNQNKILELQEKFVELYKALAMRNPELLHGGKNQREIDRINEEYEKKIADAGMDIFQVRDLLNEQKEALKNVKDLPGILPLMQQILQQQIAGIGRKQSQFTNIADAWKEAQLEILNKENEVPQLQLIELQEMRGIEQKNLPEINKKLDALGPARAG